MQVLLWMVSLLTVCVLLLACCPSGEEKTGASAEKHLGGRS